MSTKQQQGEKPRGDWGMVPQKFEVGGRPMHSSPNILRSSVVGCARKYEKSKKRCFSCEERVMYEGLCTAFNKVKIRKSVKIRKTWAMTKRRSSEIFASAKSFPFPQTWRQVSATEQQKL